MSAIPASPSPYAVPNSPIASAKRPRICRKDKATPVRGQRLAVDNGGTRTPGAPSSATGVENSNNFGGGALSVTTGSGGAGELLKKKGLNPGMTPSKIMFSPGLRTSSTDGGVSMSTGMQISSSRSASRDIADAATSAGMVAVGPGSSSSSSSLDFVSCMDFNKDSSDNLNEPSGSGGSWSCRTSNDENTLPSVSSSEANPSTSISAPALAAPRSSGSRNQQHEEEGYRCSSVEDITSTDAAVSVTLECEVESTTAAGQEAQAIAAAEAAAAGGAGGVSGVDEEGDEDDLESDPDAFNPYFFISGLPDHASTTIAGKICLPPTPTTWPTPRSFSTVSTPASSSPSIVGATAGGTSAPGSGAGASAGTTGAKLRPITLTLDLDETLVHCTVEPIDKPDLVFPVAFNGVDYKVYVRKRPYLDYFLESVRENFEVVVFTASQKVYADVLLDLLDPQHKFVQHRLFRESCLLVQGNYLKDLAVLGRDMQRTVLVDNSPHAYGYQLDNGIPIESWYDNDADAELLKLLGFLKKIEHVEDVRPYVRNQFKSHHLVERAGKGLSVPVRSPPF